MARIVEEEWTYRDGTTYKKRVPYVDCCGHEIRCVNFTQTCHVCGADYNFSGHRLAPRSQWGEETGEHWTECY